MADTETIATGGGDLADRLAKLHALRHYCQREIYCSQSATRDRMQAAAMAGKQDSQVTMLTDCKDERRMQSDQLWRDLHPDDQKVVKFLRRNGRSPTREQIADEYRKNFLHDFDRDPTGEEGEVLSEMVDQVMTILLGVRNGVDRTLESHNRRQDQHRVQRFEVLLIRAQQAEKEE